MRYRFCNNKIQLINYILTFTEKRIDENGESVTETVELEAATDKERDRLLEMYPNAVAEVVDNGGYEFLEGTSWTPEQIANGELEAAIEDDELPMSQEEINAMLMLEIAALKAGGAE